MTLPLPAHQLTLDELYRYTAEDPVCAILQERIAELEALPMIDDLFLKQVEKMESKHEETIGARDDIIKDLREKIGLANQRIARLENDNHNLEHWVRELTEK